jgi:hypothetical protein
LCAAPADLDRARQLYERTDYDAALQVLLPVATRRPADPYGS